MTNEPQERSRPIRAAMVGLATDAIDSVQRLTRLPNGTLMGGSRQSHEQMREIALRLEVELDRLGVELAEVAWRIDSPEMFEFAVRLDDGLRRRDVHFHESSPELLMEISMELVTESSMYGN